MKIFRYACIAAAAVLAVLPGHAETLRCNGNLAVEGDSRLSVLYKCGEPLLKQTYCAPVYYAHHQSLYLVPDPFASIFVPCQPVEEWLYDRGPGNLAATVRFRSGAVQSITYGQSRQ